MMVYTETLSPPQVSRLKGVVPLASSLAQKKFGGGTLVAFQRHTSRLSLEFEVPLPAGFTRDGADEDVYLRGPSCSIFFLIFFSLGSFTTQANRPEAS